MSSKFFFFFYSVVN